MFVNNKIKRKIITSIQLFIRFVVFGNRCSSERYIKTLRKKGCIIGENTTIYEPQDTVIDVTRPWMIEIGNNVEITTGCTILTHGYDWSVFRVLHGEIMGSSGKVTIGNNVFIGVNTTILKGSKIGNNVIIGANTLVNGTIPDNVVVVGNPMRIVSSVEDYYKKRMELQLKEAVEIYHCYCDRYKVSTPPIEVFYDFFGLFESEMENGRFKNALFHWQMEQGGMTEKCYEAYTAKKKAFASYDDFIAYCQKH